MNPTANIKAVITAEDRASSTLAGFGDNVDGMSLKMKAGLLAAGAAVLDFGKKSIAAFSESQDLIAQTNAVLKSTGGIAGVTADQVTQLATAWQKQSKYSDEAVRGAENILLTFTNITSDIFPQTTQAVLDISTALHEDLQSASIQVGKALQDPILGVTALRRVGVNFTVAQRDMIKSLVDTGQAAKAQQIILTELNREFGGSAQAAATTYSGKIAIIKNRFNDLEEAGGKALVNVLFPIANLFSKQNDSILPPLINNTGKYTGSVSLLQLAQDRQAEAQDRVNKGQVELKNAQDETTRVNQAAKSALDDLKTAQDNVNNTLKTYGDNSPQYKQATDNLAGAQDNYNNKQLDEINNSLTVQILEGQLKTARDKLADATNALAGWQDYFNGKLSTGISLIGSYHDAIYLQAIPAVNALQGSVSNVQTNLGGLLQMAPGRGLQGGNLNVQGFRAAGGPVTANLPYIVGENGPEIFKPNQSGTVVSNSNLKASASSSSVNISVNAGAFMGTDLEARKFAKTIFQHLQDLAGAKNMSVAEMIS